ncbi:hypothetical protein DIPPA_06225 [Diplonema papillatum]|nr:hypothetical protein DIPPA_06225 [Diplonema papillatum]
MRKTTSMISYGASDDTEERAKALRRQAELDRLKEAKDDDLRRIGLETKELKKQLAAVDVELRLAVEPDKRLSLLEEKEVLVNSIYDVDNQSAQVYETYVRESEANALSADDLRVLRGIKAMRRHHEMLHTEESVGKRLKQAIGPFLSTLEERALQNDAHAKKDKFLSLEKCRNDEIRQHAERRKRAESRVSELEKARCKALVGGHLDEAVAYPPEEILSMIDTLNSDLQRLEEAHVDALTMIEQNITEHTLTQEEEVLLRAHTARRKVEDERRKKSQEVKQKEFSFRSRCMKRGDSEYVRIRAEKTRMQKEQSLKVALEKVQQELHTMHDQHRAMLDDLREKCAKFRDAGNVEEEQKTAAAIDEAVHEHASESGEYRRCLCNRDALAAELEEVQQQTDIAAQRGLEALQKLRVQQSPPQQNLAAADAPDVSRSRELFLYVRCKQQVRDQCDLWLRKELKVCAESRRALDRSVAELGDLHRACGRSKAEARKRFQARIREIRSFYALVAEREEKAKNVREKQAAVCSLSKTEEELLASRKKRHRETRLWSDAVLARVFALLDEQSTSGKKDAKAVQEAINGPKPRTPSLLLPLVDVERCSSRLSSSGSYRSDSSTPLEVELFQNTAACFTRVQKHFSLLVFSDPVAPECLHVSFGDSDTAVSHLAGYYIMSNVVINAAPTWQCGSNRIFLTRGFWGLASAEDVETGRCLIRSDTRAYGFSPHRMKGWEGVEIPISQAPTCKTVRWLNCAGTVTASDKNRECDQTPTKNATTPSKNKVHPRVPEQCSAWWKRAGWSFSSNLPASLPLHPLQNTAPAPECFTLKDYSDQLHRASLRGSVFQGDEVQVPFPDIALLLPQCLSFPCVETCELDGRSRIDSLRDRWLIETSEATKTAASTFDPECESRLSEAADNLRWLLETFSQRAHHAALSPLDNDANPSDFRVGETVLVACTSEAMTTVLKSSVQGPANERLRYVGCTGRVVGFEKRGEAREDVCLSVSDGRVVSFPPSVCVAVSKSGSRSDSIASSMAQQCGEYLRLIACFVQNEVRHSWQLISAVTAAADALTQGCKVLGNSGLKQFPMSHEPTPYWRRATARFSELSREEHLDAIDEMQRLCQRTVNAARNFVMTTSKEFLSDSGELRGFQDFVKEVGRLCRFTHVIRQLPLNVTPRLTDFPVPAKHLALARSMTQQTQKPKQVIPAPVLAAAVLEQSKPWPPVDDAFTNSLRSYSPVAPRRHTLACLPKVHRPHPPSRKARPNLPARRPFPGKATPPRPPPPWKAWKNSGAPADSIQAVTHVMMTFRNLV